MLKICIELRVSGKLKCFIRFSVYSVVTKKKNIRILWPVSNVKVLRVFTGVRGSGLFRFNAMIPSISLVESIRRVNVIESLRKQTHSTHHRTQPFCFISGCGKLKQVNFDLSKIVIT